MAERPRALNGFTLIEMLIALLLFALISLAGIALIQAVLGVQRRADSRLERLAALQRTSYLIDNDLAQMTTGSLVTADREFRFRRHSVAASGGEDLVRYRLAGRDLVRAVGSRRHILLTGVAAMQVRYLEMPGGWREGWPPPQATDETPAAIDLSLSLDPAAGAPNGRFRRIVALPAAP